jgi:hypothetical protein
VKNKENGKELAALMFFLASLLFFIAALSVWPYDKKLTLGLVSVPLIFTLFGIASLWAFIRMVGWKEFKQAWKDAKPSVFKKNRKNDKTEEAE